jgi:hypothetical protein
MFFYLTIRNFRYRAKKNHTQHASYPRARVHPVHIQKFGVGCTGNEIQNNKCNLLSICACTHSHLFVGGTVNRCLPVASRASAWFDQAKGKISRKHACRYSWTMSAITAVEEAFKVLGDPSLPMVKRVRTSKEILFMTDTPTRMLENATFGKLPFILCLNLIPSVMLISRISQANYWWSSVRKMTAQF